VRAEKRAESACAVLPTLDGGQNNPATSPGPRKVESVVVHRAELIRSEMAVPAAFDCAMRMLALQYALQIQPNMSPMQVQGVVDALNGSPEAQCRNLTAPSRSRARAPDAGGTQVEDCAAIVVSPSGDDAAAGTLLAPLRTLGAAVRLARASAVKTILLRTGTYRENVTIDEADSSLTIANYGNEHPVMSGAVQLRPSWTRVDPSSTRNIWVASVPRGHEPLVCRPSRRRRSRDQGALPECRPVAVAQSGWLYQRSYAVAPAKAKPTANRLRRR
jgi:hypothetical protein